LTETRAKVSGLFKRNPIQKLYAISIACQVSRYLYEFDEKSMDYEKAIGGAVKLSSSNKYIKIPFLVVPSEYAKEANEAVNVLKKHGYVTKYSTDNAPPLFVIEVTLKL
ncbi:MAG: hypothetical protein HQK93_06920, partial [Nitrospirae bacterium]|nr:hypothetical protein [Nitrospirota bacterium]